ncbi:MAG: hypothetical protein ACRD1Z_01250, partial [Vicinamibacteria bacterium]
ILRIKTLLYEEGFTIAGAKKKLELEMKDQLKTGTTTPPPEVIASGSDGLKDEILSIRAELRGILELIDAHDSKRKDD